MVVSIQHHAVIGELHEQYGASKDHHGAASHVALQCLRNLAQGYCLQCNLFEAEVQLRKALRLLDEGLLRSTTDHPGAVDVMRVGIMLEMADVTLRLGRWDSTYMHACKPYLFSLSGRCLHVQTIEFLS